VFAPADELHQLDRYLGDEGDLGLLPDQKRRQFVDRLDELDDSLKAQRYRQSLAAELVDRYAGLPEAGALGKEERGHIEQLVGDLRGFRGTMEDVDEDRLLNQLRARLDVEVKDEDEGYRAFLDVLGERLELAVTSPGLASYDEGSLVRRLSEFQQALREREPA
jgi:hypothetical protein